MSIPIAISVIIRLLLAFIFLRAALHKARHYRQFCSQLIAYNLLPNPVVPVTALLLTLTEVYLAFSLPVQHWAHPAYIGAGLLTLYALALAINLWRGRVDLDCGCGGATVYPQTIGWALVLRNGVLVLLALASALPVIAQPVSILDICTIAAASIAIIFIYCSIELAITHQQRQRRYFSQQSPAHPDALV
jgi:hypothetical protein